jgi:putative aldouronate transport system permease protein
MLQEKNEIGGKLFHILNIAFFVLFTLMCTFPFYYIFINTISDNNLASVGKILFYPKGIHFGNYMQVFEIPGLWNATYISIARTVLGTALTLVGSAFLGYAFCKTEYWQRKLWYRFVVVTMYFNAGLIPWYVTMKNLGMLNNFMAYILPGIVSPASARSLYPSPLRF